MYGGRIYHCKRCGYSGAFVIEGDEVVPQAERKPGIRKVADTQNARIPLWVKTLALLFLLYILFMRF